VGKFAEQEIVEYCLSFSDQGKKASVFCFHLQQTNGRFHFRFAFGGNKRKLPYPFAELRTHGDMDMETLGWKHRDGNIGMETWRHGDIETWRHGHGDIETSNGKRKPG
jgi:hypothetical protein